MAELIIVPRWNGSERSDFYPWLIARAAAELEMTTSVVPLRPVPDAPTPEETARAVAIALANATRPIVLAHSVGCRAALIAAAALPDGHELDALICIAGWFTVDAPWPAIVPWLAEDLFSAERVRSRIRRLAAVISDNDPFTADHAATGARFEELGARVSVVPGARHFNGAEEPAAWQALAQVVRAP
jgi:uncharacterized protein